jgi:uncharacterized protein YdhG (YjbR/CyaY superfamily)
MAAKFASVDDYIASFPDDVQVILENVRRTIRGVVPDAGEKISYQMPVVTLGGKPLVHFAAWKHHLGLYPVPQGDDALEPEIAPYRATKDTVRLPYAQPIPYALIGRITELLVRNRLVRDGA